MFLFRSRGVAAATTNRQAEDLLYAAAIDRTYVNPRKLERRLRTGIAYS